MKTFAPGEHVKVIGGLYIGETGTVIATTQVAPAAAAGAGGASAGADPDSAEGTWLATLLLDSGMKQVQAFVRDLTKSSDVVSSSAVGNVEGAQPQGNGGTALMRCRSMRGALRSRAAAI